MSAGRIPRLALSFLVAALIVSVPIWAQEIKGTIKSVDPATSQMVIEDEHSKTETTVNLGALVKAGLGKNVNLKTLKPGARVAVTTGVVASRVAIEESESSEVAPQMTILEEFWYNFRHNLFKPLLLFFYLGFLVPILKVKFEFPYVMYQALTIYLLLAIGWHGGEELAFLKLSDVGRIVGFMCVGFVLNFFIGVASYLMLRAATRMRHIDQATVAGYYGSDSAGTFVTCIGVLATAHIVYDAYMPVMLALMEIPGCLVALYLVARLREKGMDAFGNMPDEPGYDPMAKAPALAGEHGHGDHPETKRERDIEQELEMSLEKREHPERDGNGNGNGNGNSIINGRKKSLIDGKFLHEVFLNTGLYLLFGGIIIGLISGLQGEQVTRPDDQFFVTLFQGVLCLFLLEMGMTASRKLKDLKSGGTGYIAFGLLAPNLFATIGIVVAHTYAYMTGTHFQPGSYILFAVLCGAASYIAVPAVQRMAIPEASPSLPLAASLGLTFSYNVTIGIPIYIEIAKVVTRTFPIA